MYTKGSHKRMCCVIRKPYADEFYDQLCHMFALMFDNIEYLLLKSVMKHYSRNGINCEALLNSGL